MSAGLEIYNKSGVKVFSSIDDRPFTILGSVTGNGTLTLIGNTVTYFHITINTTRLRDNLRDDFTPTFKLVYNPEKTQVTITAPANNVTMIGYY